MTRVAVEFEWQPIGEVALVDGKLRFANLPRTPGVYRLAFHVPDVAARVYIGETDDLRRRAQNYRTPGPTQRTSLRMNQELVETLARGVRVSQDAITDATISLNDGPWGSLDLARKTFRLMLENAAMAAVLAERKADPVRGPVLVNRPGVGEAEWS